MDEDEAIIAISSMQIPNLVDDTGGGLDAVGAFPEGRRSAERARKRTTAAGFDVDHAAVRPVRNGLRIVGEAEADLDGGPDRRQLVEVERFVARPVAAQLTRGAVMERGNAVPGGVEFKGVQQPGERSLPF